jgi:hypothetical protein
MIRHGVHTIQINAQQFRPDNRRKRITRESGFIS